MCENEQEVSASKIVEVKDKNMIVANVVPRPPRVKRV